MPKGDSPQKAQDYYHYLQAHQIVPHGRDATWHVDWSSLLWDWGFLVVLTFLILLWVWQYRTTRSSSMGISPIDTWGGYTTEQQGRVPFFFFVVSAVVIAFGAEFVIGHLINGQMF
jgi:hypothetical protein